MARTYPTNSGNLVANVVTVTDVATVGDTKPTKPYKVYFWEDDFHYYYRTISGHWYSLIGNNGLLGFSLNSIDTTDNPGLARLTIRDTVDSYASMAKGLYGSFMLGGGENVITIIGKIEDLSVAGDVTMWGFGARYGNPGSWKDIDTWDDVLMFVYDKDTSDNWLAVTRKNGTETATDTGIAVDTSFHKFEIVVNAGATSVEFKIDDNIEATTTTNIPDDLNLDHAIVGKRISATAGDQTMAIDYFSHSIELTNERY